VPRPSCRAPSAGPCRAGHGGRHQRGGCANHRDSAGRRRPAIRRPAPLGDRLRRRAAKRRERRDLAPAPRARPRGLPRPRRQGPILYFPSLVVEGVVTDNVRNSHSDRIADIGLKLAPSLAIESDWVRHAFRFSGSAERIFYADQNDYDPTAADAEASLRLDLKGGTSVALEADYDLSEASAGSDEVPQSAVGLRQDQAFGGAATVTHDVGRIAVEARAAAFAFVYSDVALADGGTENNSDRNYIEPQASLRAGYGLKPGLKPYVKPRAFTSIGSTAMASGAIRKVVRFISAPRSMTSHCGAAISPSDTSSDFMTIRNLHRQALSGSRET
jgi:hypothetical protein